MIELTPERLAELRRIATETTPGTYEWRIIETALALLGRVEQLEADNNNLDSENYELYRRIERLEAKLARQRVALRRLQATVERRNREERIEALRRAVYDETVERYMRECDAADDEAKRWRKKYEALRAGVERAVQDLRKWAHAAARDWQQSGYHPYHDGASDAYYEAEQLVRLVLAEEGGDKRD